MKENISAFVYFAGWRIVRWLPEEAAYKMGFINADQLKKLAEPLLKSGYGKHLMSLVS